MSVSIRLLMQLRVSFLFGVNDGEIISMEFINIKYEEVDEIFAGLFPPLIFFIRYNPAE